jgi:hypothetical protein
LYSKSHNIILYRKQGADLVVEGTNRKRKQNEAESSAKETPHYSSPFSDQGEDDGKLLEQDRDPSLSCDNDCDEDEAKKEDDGVGRPTKRKKTAKFKKHPNAPKRFRRCVGWSPFLLDHTTSISHSSFRRCCTADPLHSLLSFLLFLTPDSAFIIFSQQRHKDLRAKLNAEGGEADVRRETALCFVVACYKSASLSPSSNNRASLLAFLNSPTRL